VTEAAKPENPGQEVRKTALQMALQHHSQGTTPAAAKTIVVTAQAFEQFLLDGGLFDIAQVAADRNQRNSS
jgi:hypothetical protein